MTLTVRIRWFAFTAAIGAVALLANGCTGDTVNNFVDDAGTVVTADGSVIVGTKCAPSTKECVSPALARVCPADGSGWLAQPCHDGEKCDKGECKPDPNAACLPNSGACLNATTALRCRANAMGFDQINCPSGTTCEGNGLCAGSCIVGSSICLAGGLVGTCVNGNTYTPTSCGATELCVSVSSTPYPTAACKPAACTPTANGCDTVCGNKNDATADQTKFTSTCVATPTGYAWVAVGCSASQTCNPVGRACAGTKEASCASDCTPGQLRCASNQLSTQICGPDGKWGAVTACNANPAATSLICQTSPVDPTTVLCGDPICAAGARGSCDATGLRKCGPDGKLAAAGTACATGACIATGAPIGGVIPGACVTECQAGDERCTANGATSYQTCSASGRWSVPVGCPSADGGAAAATCLDYRTATSRPAKVCGGVCAPGVTRCVSGDGGTVNDAIETCSALGVWGAPASCTVGACTAGIAGAGAACVAQCIPNAVVCVGNPKPVPGTPFTGTDTFGTCTPQGALPTVGTTTCTGNDVCRRTSLGTTAANTCIECVGSGVAGGNARGTVDTRCSDPTGAAPGSAAVQTCSAGNTWTAGTLDCAASAKTCASAFTSGQPFDVCNRNDRGSVLSESYYIGAATRPGRSRGGPGPFSCMTTPNNGNLGAPIACGATPDCCSSQCQRSLYTPAVCQ